jgi:hypothetical protein
MEAAPATSPGLRERLVAFACLAFSVGAGAIGFQLGDAPPSYIAVNGVALLFAAAAILLPGEHRLGAVAPLVSVVSVTLLAATFLPGSDIDGVKRWIPLGPLQLHAGMLVVPAMVAVLPRQSEAVSLAVAAVCAALVWAQPDFAAALALFAGISAAALGRKLAWTGHATRIVAVLGLGLTAFRPDPLVGVRFVETAISDGWTVSRLLALVMALALIVAVLLPPRILVRGRPEMTASARAVTGAMAGFGLAGLLAPFPQPLVGYGASPILGYGLALAVLRFSR